jgi:hypothetical protein
MKKRMLTIITLLIIVILVVMALDLKGVASAKISFENQNSSTQKAADGVLFTSEVYKLKLIPAASGNSASQVTSIIQGGNYVLSQPISPNDDSGCCCKKYLSCVEK